MCQVKGWITEMIRRFEVSGSVFLDMKFQAQVDDKEQF